MYRIMIVEDEAIERESLEIIVSQMDEDVSIVCSVDNGIPAIEFLQKNEVDLIFMDINIPGESGLVVSEKIRELYPNVKIVIITAYNEFEFARTGIRLSVSDYLLKPIRPQKIINTIKQFMSNENSLEKDFFAEYIEKINISIIEKSYLDTISNIRSTTQYIYKNLEWDLKEKVKFLRRIAEAIYETSEAMGIDKLRKQEEILKKFRNRYFDYGNEYTAIRDLSKMTDLLFASISFDEDMKSMSLDYIITYIEINIRKNVTLDDIAEYSNLSSYHISKVFKKKMDINFITYVTNRKMEHAKEMIECTNMPISNIAFELGYSESNYFSKVFKKTVGVSPTHYREMER